MRINKYLADQGYATRRGADELIERGKVFVNGKRAKLGQEIGESDVVTVRNATDGKRYTYIAFHKPRTVITHSPSKGELDVRKASGYKDLFPVGRLDKDSSGLLILTDDGRITDRLLSPNRAHDKEYRVRVKQKLRASFKENMERGVSIEGYMTRPAKVRILGEKSFAITLTEGKKHQIRRMVAAMHNEVSDLVRVRILNVRLDKLPSGATRPIEGEELELFLEKLGLGKNGASN
jgi:23S rRNA pseudouridine2604 synthase